MKIPCKKTSALAILCILVFQNSGAQDNYDLDFKRESVLLASGLITLGSGLHISNSQRPLSQNEIAGLDASNIWSVDRFATRNVSQYSATLSDIGLVVALSGPALILGSKERRRDFWKIALIGIETIGINTGLTYLAKGLTNRTRPYVYHPNGDIFDKQANDSRQSFFSGHTSIAASSTFFTAHILSTYVQSKKYRRVLWISAATIPAFVATTRVTAGKHFLSDVTVGYAVGALTGYFIPELHKSSRKKSAFEIRPCFSGAQLVYKIK